MYESSFNSPYMVPEAFPDFNLQFDLDFCSTNNSFDCETSSFDGDVHNSYPDDFLSSCSSDTDNLEQMRHITEAFVSKILGNDTSSESDFINQTTSTTRKDSKSSKRKTVTEYSTKSWSNMCEEEKEKSLCTISEITCQMGIGEQLEVIKIINPYVEISAEMKEFTLDISLLNDSKWKRIKDYFKRHNNSFSSKNSSLKSNKPSKVTKKSNSLSRTSRKQRPKKQKLSEAKELGQMQVKRLEQGLKEEKSGLFVYEKIVKCSNLEEDEDVNILE